MDLFTVWIFLLLVFGFGFVVFFHELGHFLAAKWADVRVEQFAVGFGHALLAWRKGIGLRIGSTRAETDRRIREHINQKYGREIAEPSVRQIAEAEKELGIGETEYRINWIPLGGYVKMLGQDDLRPNAEADDPRAYNRKSVGARMVIVSAGVIMNVILAAIGFMVLFLVGFNAPAPVVGAIIPDSPAQYAVNEQGEIDPLQVGDEILSLNGTRTHDFTKVFLNAALLDADEPAKLEVRRTDGTVEVLTIQPRKHRELPTQFLELGISQQGIRELRGLDKWGPEAENEKLRRMVPDAMFAIEPGDVIVEVNGQPIDNPRMQYPVFEQALQTGKPVTLAVRNDQGQTRQVVVQPQFMPPFGETPLNFLGLIPRTQVTTIASEKSPALDKIFPGDVVLAIQTEQQTLYTPTADEVRDSLSTAGKEGKQVVLTVLRNGQTIEVGPLVPNQMVAPGQYGLGIGLGYDDAHAVVSAVAKNSAAEGAGVPAEATITGVNGQAVQSWHDVHRLLREAPADQPVQIAWVMPDGQAGQATLEPTADERTFVSNLRYTHSLQLAERREIRKTTNPALAAWWGVTETRDFILQFYVTLNRMFTGEISYKNMMGPVGIFHAGTKIGERGYDWLLWFLCMISANLAVVNFLPIPIVDGGLFTFLILEKIQGKPLSPKAQSIAQVVGLALLLGIFLLVTYQDISRMFLI